MFKYIFYFNLCVIIIYIMKNRYLIANQIPNQIRNKYLKPLIKYYDKNKISEKLVEIYINNYEKIHNTKAKTKKFILGRYGSSIQFDYKYSYFRCFEKIYQTQLKEYVEKQLKIKLQLIPYSDPSRLFLLKYNKKGMHISYHYDNNFYKGRYFTVLVILDNLDKKNSSKFCYLNNNNEMITFPENVGDIIIFEGTTTFHKASCMKNNSIRIVLSCTYTTDNTLKKPFFLNLKNKAFF